ncbi:hypothetical protein AB1Y20_006744 [Prymnesium parvum]|uniref:Ribosome biogenesis protein NOP53 n=1 Tax=Prymnesium parvum TaxID=97485 RepID=A0AB34IZ69_PRYPA
MGKAEKKKKKKRFSPMERGDKMNVDSSQPAPKPLSAHQARHLERKRLQAEASELKRQRGKVSKALSKFQYKAEKKALSKNLNVVKAAAASLRSTSFMSPAEGAEPESSSPFSFNLPICSDTHATGSWPEMGRNDQTHIPPMKG